MIIITTKRKDGSLRYRCKGSKWRWTSRKLAEAYGHLIMSATSFKQSDEEVKS